MLNKGERIAVISLLSIIAVLLAFSVFRPALHFSDEDNMAFHNLDSLIALRKEVPAPEHQTLTFAEQKSMSKQASNPTSKPAASTPASTTSKPSTPSKPSAPPKTSKSIPVLELNTTDSIELVELPQIGEVMASRIQRYRDRLGGFVSLEQLYEVKGMDSARFATASPYLLIDTTSIKKLDINRDEFKTLLRHPYLEYDQVKAIVNHRESKGLIRNWEQLQEITGEVNPLLERYASY